MEFDNSVNIITKPEFIKIEIDEFNLSKERQLMLKGEKYYKAENDILDRERYRYEDETKVLDDTKPNHRLSHGFMHVLVEDKVNYLLGKDYVTTCEDENYLTLVQDTLGRNFQSKLKKLGVQSSNKGIAWLQLYIDNEGNFKTMIINSEEVIPIWENNEREKLQALIRYYEVETYEGKEKKYVTKIEYHTADGVEFYTTTADGEVILDAERYLTEDGEDILLPHFKINEEPGTWGRVPFVPFKNNDYELPDLQFVKTIIDDYDLTRSDVSNLLEEITSIIYVLKGYGGASLSEFVRDLAYYRGIKIDPDENAGVDTIENTVNIDAAEKHWKQLKEDIYAFGQGVNKDVDKLGNSPSGIALKFLYSGLDLKGNAMETNFKWAFEQLIYFVDVYLTTINEKVSDEDVVITFNRDIAINESAAITDAQNSKGVISDKTIVANHPWVGNVKDEMKQIEEESKMEETPPCLGEADLGEDGDE